MRNGFRTTQLLTGKGVFNSYRKHIGKCDTDKCWYCPEVYTPEHTIFFCIKQEEPRAKMKSKVPEAKLDDEFVARVVENRKAWEAFEKFAEEVIGTKEGKER